MNKDKFYQKLAEGDLEVTFEKKTDGSIRTMKCTANAPKSDKPEQKRVGGPESLITVYDSEAKGWRSFYSDSIKEIKPLNTTFGILQE